MRAALITIAEQPRDSSGAALAVAGKPMAHQQLEFALAAGCERIIALGNGNVPEVVGLRRAAEDAGAQLLAVGNCHAFPGTVRGTDELMVLGPGLLPDEHSALPALQRGSVILTLPAGPGVAAGFERIDLERAWAGVALVPGSLIERLAELPADAQAPSALLRLALQARVPESRLPERVIADGSWAIVDDGSDAGAIGRAWLDRRLLSHAAHGLSSLAAAKGLRFLAPWLLERERSFAGLTSGAVALLCAAVAASWLGRSSIGLALVIAGAFTVELALGLLPLLGSRFRQGGRRASLLLPKSVDLALLTCGVFAIEGDWLHRLFPPVVLLAALYLRPREEVSGIAQGIGDRALLAALFALAAIFGFAEAAIMAAGLAIILYKVIRREPANG